ncbi:hypothetical protein F5884DRAFT_897204 [Xylogone sp. PMI_703]|nr:hypothetical protein F5884DRAFT_897204 [Xylogone sp. PMI_703]
MALNHAAGEMRAEEEEFVRMYTWWTAVRSGHIDLVATPSQHEDPEIRHHDLTKPGPEATYDSPGLQHHTQPYMINPLSSVELLSEEELNIYNDLNFDFNDLLNGEINVDMIDIGRVMTPGFTPAPTLAETPWPERGGEEEEEEEAEDEPVVNIKSPVADANAAEREIKPRRHHTVEKRYRANLNEKIACLDRLVSGECKDAISEKARAEALAQAQAQANGTGKPKAYRQNKTAVLSKAIQYIQDLQQDNTKLRDGIDLLRKRAVEARKSLAEDGL